MTKYLSSQLNICFLKVGQCLNTSFQLHVLLSIFVISFFVSLQLFCKPFDML
jgi:hypothetical protein